MQTNTPATWPDNTKLPHPTKVAAIKTICAQSRQSRPLPAVWPEPVAALAEIGISAGLQLDTRSFDAAATALGAGQ